MEASAEDLRQAEVDEAGMVVVIQVAVLLAAKYPACMQIHGGHQTDQTVNID